jgi:isocitrate/isopropylmalate dehydrogenase
MASTAKRKGVATAKVRVPSELYRSLDDFVADLQSRILETASRRAEQRLSNQEYTYVTESDLLHVARSLFSNATAELEEHLQQSTVSHVRRNAS